MKLFENKKTRLFQQNKMISVYDDFYGINSFVHFVYFGGPARSVNGAERRLLRGGGAPFGQLPQNNVCTRPSTLRTSQMRPVCETMFSRTS